MTIEATTQFTIGQHITDIEELQHLPIGATIGNRRAEYERDSLAMRPCSGGGTLAFDNFRGYLQSYTITVQSLPEPEFAVGQPIGSIQRLAALPIGTEVEYRGGSFDETHVKVSEHGWRVLSSSSAYSQDQNVGHVRDTNPVTGNTYFDLQSNIITKVGDGTVESSSTVEPEATPGPRAPEIGQTPTRDEMALLPLGTVMRHTGGSTYTRVGDGFTADQTGGNYGLRDFYHPYYVIQSLPVTDEPTVEYTVGRTIESYGEDIHATFAALPVGTEVRNADISNISTKGADGNWTTVSGRGFEDHTREGSHGLSGVNVITRIGPAPTARPVFNIGDRVRAANPAHTSEEDGQGWVDSDAFGQVGDVMRGPDSNGDYFVSFPVTSQYVRPEDLTLEPTVEASQYTVGQIIPDLAMVRALPVDTVVNLYHSSSDTRTTANPFVKREGHFDFRPDDGSTVDSTYSFTDFSNGCWYIQELPGSTVEPAAPEFVVGQHVSGDSASLDALPIGTVLASQNGGLARLEKRDHDHFSFVGDTHRYRNAGVGRTWMIHSLPSSTVEPPAAPTADTTPIPGQPTLQQHAERVRTVIRGATLQTDKRVQVYRVDNAFTEMGLTRPQIAPGTLLSVGELASSDFSSSLPDGTILVPESTTDEPTLDDMKVKSTGEWYTMGGSYASLGGTRQVYRVQFFPGRRRPEWVSAVGSAHDQMQIDIFNQKVGEVAHTLKSQHGWCEVVDQTLEHLDLEVTEPEDVEPETEDVVVMVSVQGTSTDYWDDEFNDILGHGVRVDNPHIDVKWTMSDIEVTVSDVAVGECACDSVDRSMVEGHVEGVPHISDWSIDGTSCSNC